LHRYVAALLGPRGEAAEDLMVEALVEAARNIGRFDDRKATFTAWLFGIARWQVQLELRRQHQRKSVPIQCSCGVRLPLGVESVPEVRSRLRR